MKFWVGRKRILPVVLVEGNKRVKMSGIKISKNKESLF